jgi:hypothetical protein
MQDSLCLNRLHLVAGLPQQDSHDRAGLSVGEQVKAFEPGLLACAGKLFSGKMDGVAGTIGPLPGL